MLEVGHVYVEHQLRFSGSETIRAIQNYENLASHHGVIVENYLGNNGVFKASAFVGHLRNKTKISNIAESIIIIKMQWMSEV